jgi:glutamyl/glutaminyl-tRNA synthetase
MKGYLPQALKNYFFLLGLGNPEQKDVYSEEEMVRLFSFERFNKNGPVFDLDKLTWLNGLYIRSMTTSELLNVLIAERFIPEDYHGDLVYLEKVVALAQERLKVLSEFWDDNRFFFEDIDVAPELMSRYIGDEGLRKRFIDEVHFNLTKLEVWNIDEIEATLRRIQSDFELKPKDAFMTIRIALSAQEHTPPLFDMVELLGREVVLKRLNVHI